MDKQVNEAITEKDLAEEISTILSDELVATFCQKDNTVTIKFLNGQNFILTVKQV